MNDYALNMTLLILQETVILTYTTLINNHVK